MRYLISTLSSLLAAAGLRLAPWMGPAVALAVFALLSPFIVRGRRLKLALKRLQRASQAERHLDRLRLQQEALDTVGQDPMGLVGVAEEALQRGMRPLAIQAMERLEATGKQRGYLRALTRKLEDDKPKTPEGEAAAIERLIGAGMTDLARDRFEQAARRWPRADAIEELRPRLRRLD